VSSFSDDSLEQQELRRAADVHASVQGAPGNAEYRAEWLPNAGGYIEAASCGDQPRRNGSLMRFR